MFKTAVLLQSEKEFILRCIREVISPGESCLEVVPALLRNLNWDWIVNTSDTHRVLPFVTYILIKRGLLRHLDTDVQGTLRANLLKSHGNNWIKQQQFQLVNEIFSEHAIAVMPLKGSLLTHLIYTHAPFREMCDLDLLVKQSDLKRTFRLLTEAGFRRLDAQSINRWQEKICAATDPMWDTEPLGRISLAREGVEVDLHFNPRYRIEQKYVAMDVAHLWKRATPFPSLGPNVYVPDPKDLLTHLLLHTVEFYSPRLIQVLDTAAVIERYQISTKDISAQLNIVSSLPTRSNLDAFIKAIHELLNLKRDGSTFSRETTEIFERFFSRTSAPDETVEGFKAGDSIRGIEILKSIKSPWKRVMFISGYLFPNPAHYGNKKFLLAYPTHWRRLMSKVWKLCRLKLRRPYEPVSGSKSRREG